MHHRGKKTQSAQQQELIILAANLIIYSGAAVFDS